jgi:hypothetical protein
VRAKFAERLYRQDYGALGQTVHQFERQSSHGRPIDPLGMTKRKGPLKGREPLPRARAVVGVVGTSISSPFCAKIKKSHNRSG